MKLFFYYLLQWTWGLPQNLLGLVVWLICKGETQPRFHGAAIKRWRRSSGSAGIGRRTTTGSFCSTNTATACNPLSWGRCFCL